MEARGAVGPKAKQEMELVFVVIVAPDAQKRWRRLTSWMLLVFIAPCHLLPWPEFEVGAFNLPRGVTVTQGPLEALF